MDHDWTGLKALAVEQHNVLSREQLTRLGLGWRHIRDHVRARRWKLYGKRVVVLHRGPLTSEQRKWVAVLELGQGAALCGLTATPKYGMEHYEPERVHVVVRHGARIRHFPWLKVHESRRFRPDTDVHPARTPPIVRAERAVIDAAVWTRNPRSACAILAAAVRLGVSTPERLLDELLDAGRVRHHRLLAAVLQDIEGGSQALSEIDFTRLCQRARLPTPRRQVLRTDSDGRRRYLDAEFRLPDGRILVVEIDGAIHLQPGTWYDDQLRQNDISISGCIVLRFPSPVVRREPEVVVKQLRAVFQAHCRVAA